MLVDAAGAGIDEFVRAEVLSVLWEVPLDRVIGAAPAGPTKGHAVKLLIADQNIRVIDLQGQPIRELMLDPSRDYQPLRQGLVSTMS
jgi:hypothetical protein